MTESAATAAEQPDERSGESTEQALARLEQEVSHLRAELARLDADLDESRRLNLRAAELLDIVYQMTPATPAPDGER